MDGYLDQQVPYTLANVRMEKSVLNARYVLLFGFFLLFSCRAFSTRSGAPGSRSPFLSRLHELCSRRVCALVNKKSQITLNAPYFTEQMPRMCRILVVLRR